MKKKREETVEEYTSTQWMNVQNRKKKQKTVHEDEIRKRKPKTEGRVWEK
jgi:hypothetical protein